MRQNAYLWLYPPKDAGELQGEQDLRYHTRYYKSDEKVAGHELYSTCGVLPVNKLGGSKVKAQEGVQDYGVPETEQEHRAKDEAHENGAHDD